MHSSHFTTRIRSSLLPIVAAAAALASLALASPAFALDGKTYPSSACTAYSSGSANILISTIGYIRNTSSSASALVMCPIVKDVVGGTNASYVRVSYTKANTTGFYCAFYGRTHSGGGSYVKGKWDFGGSGTKTMSFSNLGGYSSGTYELHCVLPPGAKLHSYRLDES